MRENLADQTPGGEAAKPWMRGFGRLRSLRGETQRIQGVIDKELGVDAPFDNGRSQR